MDTLCKNSFVARTREKWELNQYWYSPNTIAVLAKEIEEHATKVAFLSTPSVWFSLNKKELKQCSFFFDVSHFRCAGNYVDPYFTTSNPVMILSNGLLVPMLMERNILRSTRFSKLLVALLIEG